MRALRAALLVMTLSGCASTPEWIPSTGGVRLFSRSAGTGPPIVVLHGGPGMDHGSLAADLEPLTAGHTLVFYDQRGGGRSTLPADPELLAIEHHVDDLEAVRRALGVERLTLLAHSFGPAIAALYAIRFPDHVERMVFLGPIPPRRDAFFEEFGRTMRRRLSERDRARAAELAHAIEHGTADPVEACRELWTIQIPPRLARGTPPGVVRSDLCSAPAEAIRYGMATTHPRTFDSLGEWDWTPALRSVRVPTLVIHGEEDAIPLRLVRAWVRALPDARMLLLPRTGHFPHAERPDLVFPAIESFLAGTWPRGSRGPERR